MTDNENLTRNFKILNQNLHNCELCPRVCHANRISGETGFCGLDSEMVISAVLPHHGEEPPISGNRGAGTIFFSSCNLRCCYCQNYQISHTLSGRRVSSAELAEMMIALQSAWCHNIELVTPTPHLPGIIEALTLARRKGLYLPLVFNCGGYERKESIALLDGRVDIYLPDFKYGIAETGAELSGVSDYPRHALASLREMVRQTGDMLDVDENGVALRGIIVRHLVLPGYSENSIEALKMIRGVSPFIPLGIMSQYTPVAETGLCASGGPSRHALNRRITADEYEYVVNAAIDMGFEEIYTQDVDDRSVTPDFHNQNPFDWGTLGENSHA